MANYNICEWLFLLYLLRRVILFNLCCKVWLLKKKRLGKIEILYRCTELELNNIQVLINSKTMVPSVKSDSTQLRRIKYTPPCIYPVVVDVWPMCYHSSRYGTFSQYPGQLPPGMWANQLAAAGYFYENGSIICFACRLLHPEHASDCPHEHENISSFHMFPDPPSAGGGEDSPSDIVNVRPSASDGAANIQPGPSYPVRSWSEMDYRTDTPPDLPVVGAVRPAGGLSMPTDREVNRQSFTEDWRGPPISTMVNCGLHQLSRNAAKCRSCQNILRNLTPSTLAPELLRGHAQDCPVLRTQGQMTQFN